MSPPTTSTRVAARRSARPARPDWSRPACSGLPGIASTVSLNHPRSPAMLADRSAISIANSETGQWRREPDRPSLRRSDLHQARYRGLAKTHLQHVLTALAINLVRVDGWLTGVATTGSWTSRLARLAQPLPAT